MTKGTRMWLSGIGGMITWFLLTGLNLMTLIDHYDKGDWGWVTFAIIAVIGSIIGFFDSARLLKKSHNQE